MHAAHSGCVPIQHVHALAAGGVPHAQRPVCGAADDRGVHQLTAPHAARVTRQRPQTLWRETRRSEGRHGNRARRPLSAHLSRGARPHFERVVVGAADDQVAAELQTCDHMIIVTLQHLQKHTLDSSHSSAANAAAHLGLQRVAAPPLGVDALLVDVGGLPGARRTHTLPVAA